MKPPAIAELLPDVIQRTSVPGSVLESVIGVMSDLHEPVDLVLAEFDRYVDPYRCPARFVPYLAEWVGLAWLVGARGDVSTFPTGDGPLRNVVASAESLAKQRGTAVGLRRMLTLATDRAGFRVEIDDRIAFHIVVRGPETARPFRDLVALIIRHEKPAFVTADLALGDEPPTPLGYEPAVLAAEPPTAPPADEPATGGDDPPTGGDEPRTLGDERPTDEPPTPAPPDAVTAQEENHA